MAGISVLERSASRMSDSDSYSLLATRFDAWLPATRPSVVSLAVRRWTIGAMLNVMTLAAALGLSGGAAHAEVISGVILGSGINANLSTTFRRDSNWKIVAVPAGYTPPDSQTVPYDAYVPQTVAASWLGSGGASGPQTGYTTNEITYHWIAPDSSVTALSTALTPVTTTEPSTWYKWIAAQTFTIPADNNYFLNFPSAVDNRLDYFVNGVPDFTNPRQPTITGGFQITTTNTAPGQFLSISNNTNTTPIFLAAGTHTAFMVLTDLGNATGVLIGPSEFSTVPVPEPTSLSMLSAAAGAMVLVLRRRRFRRN